MHRRVAAGSSSTSIELQDQQAITSGRVELLHRLLGEDVCRQLGVYRLPPGFLLSVIIPVFNEATTVEEVIARVRSTGLPVELVLVDDGSTDGTCDVLRRFEDERGLPGDLP